MSTDRTPQDERTRARESAAALAALERRAAAQGVRPLKFDELLGDPDDGDPEKEDVNDFLALRREWHGYDESKKLKLPNAERAVVEIEKLRDYALNPDHDEGKHKARVFRATLGFTSDDAERLRTLVLNAVHRGEASLGKLTRHGQMYTLDFAVEGLRGEVVIRTGWIVEHDSDFPRLVTCYVN